MALIKFTNASCLEINTVFGQNPVGHPHCVEKCYFKNIKAVTWPFCNLKLLLIGTICLHTVLGSNITIIVKGFIKEPCNFLRQGLRGESPSPPQHPPPTLLGGLAFLKKMLILGAPKSEFQSMLSDQGKNSSHKESTFIYLYLLYFIWCLLSSNKVLQINTTDILSLLKELSSVTIHWLLENLENPAKPAVQLTSWIVAIGGGGSLFLHRFTITHVTFLKKLICTHRKRHSQITNCNFSNDFMCLRNHNLGLPRLHQVIKSFCQAQES